jgi:hypothetical protein
MPGMLGVNGLQGGMTGGAHSNHSQTPTSIKALKTPDYFPEFKAEGWEEAVFLGAQVAARVIFVMDQGSGGFMTRSQVRDSHLCLVASGGTDCAVQRKWAEWNSRNQPGIIAEAHVFQIEEG